MSRKKSRLLQLTTASTFLLASQADARPQPADGDSIPEVEESKLVGSDSNACFDPIEYSPQDEDICRELAYRHPLMGVKLTDSGKVPLVEEKDSRDGRRYAIVNEGGQTTEHSEMESIGGVRTIQKTKISDARRRILEQAKAKLPKASRFKPSVIGESLQRAVAIAKQNKEEAKTLAVTIDFSRAPVRTIQQQLEIAIGQGRIRTFSDLNSERSRLVEQKRKAIARELAPQVQLLKNQGVEVDYVCQMAHCVSARMPSRLVRKIASINTVARMDLAEEGVNDQAAVPVDNAVLNEVHSTIQFQSSGFLGDDNNPNITCAIMETNGFRDTHRGFREGSGTQSRIRGRFDCESGNQCVAVTAFANPDDHATRVAGIAFADFDDNQSPSYTSEVEQDRRSAPAAEARCYLYQIDNNSNDLNVAWDHAATRSPAPELVNMSFSSYSSDRTCTGADTRARNVNESLFENGILPIKSAGNDREDFPAGGWNAGSATNCTIGSPGAAIGVFTVAGLGQVDFDDMCDVHNATVTDRGARGRNSSWGGNATEGGGRTIVDLAAQWPQRNRLSWTNDNLATETFGGTSAATPLVSSAALAYVDQYASDHSDLIRDPGILFANLLLMGDRAQDGSAVGLNSEFDSRYGAGRMRMRMFNHAGMDGPWFFSVGSTCIDHDEEYLVDIGPGPVSSDVDVAKAVIWWYDRRHETGADIDDIDLELLANGGILRSSINWNDNKERVFANSGVGGNRIQLRLRGYNVTSDGEGCGSNSMRVYWAAFVEDSDRDDSDDLPDWNATSCVGVQPE